MCQVFESAGGAEFANGLRLLWCLVKLKITLTEVDEIVVERDCTFGKDITPLEAQVHIVEDETAGESVFGIRNEGKDLLRSA